MFESIRRPLVLLSFLLVGCADANEMGAVGESTSTADGESSNGEGTGAPGAASGSEGAASPSSNDPSSAADAGTSDAAQPLAPPTAPLTCTRCATYADDQLGASLLIAQDMCNADAPAVPDSIGLYQAYLGCMCSGPCATECGSTLCALVPAVASPSCTSCIQLSNAVCGAEKSACQADQ